MTSPARANSTAAALPGRMLAMSISRRTLIAGAGAALAVPVAARQAFFQLPGGPQARAVATDFPQKGAMIVQRTRPPLLETPFEVFDDGIFTPNDRFFVRWSGGEMPTSIDVGAHRLTINGAVTRPVALTLDDVMRAGEPVEVVAVNQCAGNGRGLQEARVGGAQWGDGAMGNARWRGVRLRDVLARAGLAGTARRVRFGGLDRPAIEGQPRFTKSLPVDIALLDEVIVAWGMNGQPLPLLNGYPLRLVVPGWFATYWVKMLSDIEVLASDEDDSYFMAKTYRMPADRVQPGDKGFPTVPVTTMGPRSWITSHPDMASARAGRPLRLRGIAMGGTSGVASVDLVVDGQPVASALLEPEHGALGFRRWSATVFPRGRTMRIGPRCMNRGGDRQPEVHAWNPSGYARHSVAYLALTVI